MSVPKLCALPTARPAATTTAAAQHDARCGQAQWCQRPMMHNQPLHLSVLLPNASRPPPRKLRRKRRKDEGQGQKGGPARRAHTRVGRHTAGAAKKGGRSQRILGGGAGRGAAAAAAAELGGAPRLPTQGRVAHLQRSAWRARGAGLVLVRGLAAGLSVLGNPTRCLKPATGRATATAPEMHTCTSQQTYASPSAQQKEGGSCQAMRSARSQRQRARPAKIASDDVGKCRPIQAHSGKPQAPGGCVRVSSARAAPRRHMYNARQRR